MAKQKNRWRKWKFFLFLLLCTLGGEWVARQAYDPYDADFLFNWFFWDQQHELAMAIVQAGPDAEVKLNSSGFRGDWVFGEKTSIPRVIVTGAGHSFADNVVEGKTWTDQLQQKLSHHLGSSIELWNLSVPGSTVLFTERALLPRILNAKPEVVILSHCGFNEALYSDISESWVLKPDANIHNFLLSSQLIRFFIQFSAKNWRKLHGGKRFHKVGIDEFEESYQNIISQLQHQGISVVLLKQVVIYPDMKGLWKVGDMSLFRAKFDLLSQRYKLDLFDPLDFMQGELKDYFEREEYYNEGSHQKIAEGLFPIISNHLDKSQ